MNTILSGQSALMDPGLGRDDGKAAAPASIPRFAVIDIGSNSIRLVVYDGPARVPAVLFNEKVMAGLGRSLGESGRLEDSAVETALKALARFQRLCLTMGVSQLRTVATAAVREASNGAEFVARVEALGLPVELLSGEQEAVAAGYGVISGIPEADGIAGDLGGGSLELVRVKRGRVLDRASFPLGVLRIAEARAKGEPPLERLIEKQLDRAAWLEEARGLPFYLVGGSWRSLARLDMHLTGYPLPILHSYRMEPVAPDRLVRVLARTDKATLRALPSLSASRVPMLADAAALLATLVRQLGSSELVVSAFGLREGLLFERLSEDEQGIDPLIAAAREEADRQGRFPEHGDLLDRWIAPLFAGEAAADQRLRHAACLLSDVGWRTNPEFRAERGLEAALHGNWAGIDARGRAMVGQALFTNFGGGAKAVEHLTSLCSEEELGLAIRWGLAIRLGQRLSGGIAGPLKASRLAREDGALLLRLPEEERALYGEAVERRHRQLASAMELEAKVEFE